MLKELLEKERDYLRDFFEKMDIPALEEFAKKLYACKGVLIFSGVGKSGLVAEKIAMTMTSTCTRAFFLSPSNALHGDIGLISSEDMVIMLSKSGESDELLHMIPFMRNKGAKIAALVTNPKSRLAKAVDFFLTVPAEKELCPYDLAPTTSTVIQLIIGDALAIALMEMNEVTLEQYAKNHPAGRIGRRITMRVKDLMIAGTSVPMCAPSDKLIDTLVELSNKKCGCVLIVDGEGILLGIFTDGDLRRSLQKFGPKTLESEMKQLMIPSPQSIGYNELASDALRIMEGNQKSPITVLAVLDEGKKVVGLIKLHDILQSGL